MLNLKASTCRPIGLVEYNPHLDSSLSARSNDAMGMNKRCIASNTSSSCGLHLKC
uniref:Uncharacterized protein n=1 Tax=Physcomitrium patens TaxID=3218 RepID=A0A2K1K254_PHYPA|nr:hypothetical protein PHYPA_012329 [Physcomitrium patens]